MSEVTFIQPDQEIKAEVPVTPLGWRVLIRPYEPPAQSEHGIFYADESIENEAILTYVGQVVAMGSECYKAVTRSGIDLSKVDPKPTTGDWVIFSTHGGQKVITKAGVKYMLMNDDAIMGIVKNPHEFRAYL